jgi:hypothetical protein
MKIRSVGAELFHADGRTDSQTDVTQPIVAFRNFLKAPKTEERIYHLQHLELCGKDTYTDLLSYEALRSGRWVQLSRETMPLSDASETSEHS